MDGRYDHLLFMVVLVKFLNDREMDDDMKFEIANKYMWN